MAALDGCNAQADHTVWAASVVLWVLVGPLNMQRKLCTCCYLLHHLLGPQCLLVKALRSQVVEVINKGFSSVAMQISTIHCCIAFEYDVSCIIGTYLYACVKASATASVSDPGGRILTSFRYLGEKLSHGRYVERPLPPSLKNLLFYSSDMTYIAYSMYPAYPFILMRRYFISIHYIPHCTTVDFMIV